MGRYPLIKHYNGTFNYIYAYTVGQKGGLKGKRPLLP